MATVLFIGGVSPDVTQEDLMSAFSQHASVLASSVVRSQSDGKCVGQAYVTVVTEDVPTAVTVTEVGGNRVAIFPVDVEAWVAPTTGLRMGSETQTGGGGGVWSPTFRGGSGGGGLAAAPGSVSDHHAGGSSLGNVHLQAVLDQMRALVASSPRMTYNGKPYYTLLHEMCQKGQMTLQVAEAPDGAAFACTINVIGTAGGGVPVCSGRATGPSKKDAKHNAAAACLDKLLATGQVMTAELMAAMTCAAPNTVAGGGGGGGGPDGFGGGVAMTSAAASAMSQTQSIMRLGMYPRCEEVMRQVHGSEQGRVKTILMVLNEYAVRARLSVQHDEITVAGGPFRYNTKLTDPQGKVVAMAAGLELRSKQEARQAAAAAVIEHVINYNLATVDAIARGK